MQFLQLQKLRDLDLGSDRGHTGGHIRSRSTHTPNLIEIGKNFADVQMDTLDFQSIMSSPGESYKVVLQTKTAEFY